MNNVHVLLVDDSLSDQVMIRRAFDDSDFSHSLSVANNGQEALDFLSTAEKEKRMPDIVFMDINMPVMNGKETLRKIRNDCKFNYLPIIMLSSSNTERDVFESYKLGCNAFITKPISDVEVLQKVTQIQAFWFDAAVLPTN